MFSVAEKTVKPSIRVQRKTDQSFFGSQKENKIATSKPSFFQPSVQTKLKVNQPNDQYEQEADLIADRVVNMPDNHNGISTAEPPEVQRQEGLEEEEEAVQTSAISLQRMTDGDEEGIPSVQSKQYAAIQRNNNKELASNEDEEESIQTFSKGRISSLHKSGVIQLSGRGPPVPDKQFQNQLHNSISGGRPMTNPVGEFMSSRFAADFSSVRIHTDTTAQNMSKEVNAHAFTFGNHIYFNSGKYDPESSSGKTLLAHELTHTIQQGASPVISNVQRKHAFTSVQRKSILQRQTAPQLTKAVELAEAEQGKVIANKTGPDGNRVGWERLIEYFETTFGKDKIVSQPNGAPNIVWREHIKKRDTFEGLVVQGNDNTPSMGERDVMPSWCGIFAFWALNKAGIPMPKWKLAESFIPPEAAYPPGYTPKPGDLAYRKQRSHYGLVIEMVGANQVKSVNGNTAGDDNLGGEIQVQTHDLSSWQGFFNPMVAKTGNLRDPELGDEETEPKTLKEIRKEKFNVNRKIANENKEESNVREEEEEEEELQPKLETIQRQEEDEEEEEIQAKSQQLEKIDASIQRAEIGNSGGFASIGEDYESDDSEADIQTKAESSEPIQVRNKSPGKMIQGGWLGDAWDAVSGLASDVADLIDEGIDAAKEWLLEKVRDFVVEIPGYTLLCYIIGYDPVTGRPVDKTPLTLLDAVLDIIPIGGSMVRWVLNYFEATNPVANWLFDSVKRFSELISTVESRFERFWDSLCISDARDPEAVIERVANLFRSVVTDIVSFVADVGGDFLIMVKDIAVTKLVNFVKNNFPDAYDLLTVLLGEDPITKQSVDRNGINILNAGLKVLGERGAQIKNQMVENGIFDQCVAWIDRSIKLVLSLISDIGNIFDVIWAAISFESLFSPIETFTNIAEAFFTPIERIVDFVTDAMVQLLGILRDALLSRLSEFAKETRGYFLITVLIGKDPFTGKVVRRNTENIIHGFFSLMDGGEEQFQQMKESGAIDRMTQKITKAVNKLDFTWEYIVGLFTSLWESLDWSDFLNIPAVFIRIIKTFGNPIVRLIRFITTIVKIAIEILMVVMNFPIDTINNIIARALEAFGNIKRDPIGFLKNLLRGIKQGFIQFFDNILEHLMSGIANWLFGSLGELGIQMPPDLSFKSILNLVLQILGISVDRIMDRVWLKLTEQIGAEKVAKIRGAIDKLTGIWTFIRDVIERGPIAIWEYVQEKLSELWDVVINAAKNWIMTRIIESVTTKLLSMLDPTGIMAVINSVIAIYRAIQSFIEQLRAMLEILNSFVNGVAEIAAGNVKVAADFLEGAMARGIPVLIGFLANQVGLGGIGRKMAEIIAAVREKITEGIDWLVGKALRIGRPIIDGVLRVIEFGEGVVENVRSAFGSVFGFNAGGESHRIWAENNNGNTQIKVASDPMVLDNKIAQWREAAGSDQDKLSAINDADAQNGIAKQKASALASAEQAAQNNQLATAQSQLDAQMEILKSKVIIVFNLMPETVEGPLSGKVGVKYIMTDPGPNEGKLNSAGVTLQTDLQRSGYAVVDKSSERKAYIMRTSRGESLLPAHFDELGFLRMGRNPNAGAESHTNYQISNVDFMDFEGDTRDTFKINITTENGNTFEASLMENDLEATTQVRTETQAIRGANLARQRDVGVSGRSTMNTTTAGLDRAHLIANRFQGPGEAQSLNIILTSAYFNRTVMAGVEDNISTWVGQETESERNNETLPADGVFRFNMRVEAVLEFNEGRSLARAILNRLIAQQFVPEEVDQTSMMNQIFESLLREARTEQTGNELRRKTKKVKYFVNDTIKGDIGPDNNI